MKEASDLLYNNTNMSEEERKKRELISHMLMMMIVNHGNQIKLIREQMTLLNEKSDALDAQHNFFMSQKNVRIKKMELKPMILNYDPEIDDEGLLNEDLNLDSCVRVVEMFLKKKEYIVQKDLLLFSQLVSFKEQKYIAKQN